MHPCNQSNCDIAFFSLVVFFPLGSYLARSVFSSIVFCALFSCHPVIMWARWTKQGKEPRWRRKKSFCIFKSVVECEQDRGSWKRGGSSEKERGRKGLPLLSVQREERGRDRGKGACAMTMDRVCTPENWPAQKNTRLSLGMR